MQGIAKTFVATYDTQPCMVEVKSRDVLAQSNNTSTSCQISVHGEHNVISFQLPIPDLSDHQSSPYNAFSQSVVSTSDNPSSSVAQGTHQTDSTNSDTVALVDAIDHSSNVDDADGLVETIGYATSSLPGATGSFLQHYESNFDKNQSPSLKQRRKDVRIVPKEKDAETILKFHCNNEASSKKKLSSELQATAKPSTKPKTSSNVDTPPRFPRRACVVYKNEQYNLDPKLLSLPKASKYLVKVRMEISPGRFMAKLELHCARYSVNLLCCYNLQIFSLNYSEDTKLLMTAATSNKQVIPVRERKHFRSNIDKTGYVIFSVSYCNY